MNPSELSTAGAAAQAIEERPGALAHLVDHLQALPGWLLVRLAETFDPANLSGALEILRRQRRHVALAALLRHAEERWWREQVDQDGHDERIVIIVDGARVYHPPAAIARQIRAAEALLEEQQAPGVAAPLRLPEAKA